MFVLLIIPSIYRIAFKLSMTQAKHLIKQNQQHNGPETCWSRSGNNLWYVGYTSVASLRTDHFYSSYDLRKRILTVRTVSSLLLGYTFNAV